MEVEDDEDDTTLQPWLDALDAIVSCDDDNYHASHDGVEGACPVQVRPPPSRLPVMLTPWLYLGDMESLWFDDDNRLGRVLGITHILSTNEMESSTITELRAKLMDRGIHHHCALAGKDERGYDMMANHWESALEFIHEATSTNQKNDANNNRVLVHCMAGVNRSVLIACAAWMALERKPLLEVVEHVRKQRDNKILTNTSFQRQLCSWATREGLLGPSHHPPIHSGRRRKKTSLDKSLEGACIFL